MGRRHSRSGAITRSAVSPLDLARYAWNRARRVDTILASMQPHPGARQPRRGVSSTAGFVTPARSVASIPSPPMSCLRVFSGLPRAGDPSSSRVHGGNDRKRLCERTSLNADFTQDDCAPRTDSGVDVCRGRGMDQAWADSARAEPQAPLSCDVAVVGETGKPTQTTARYGVSRSGKYRATRRDAPRIRSRPPPRYAALASAACVLSGPLRT